MGHDEKHCSRFPGKSEAHKQYGDWLQANNGSKGGFEKQKAASNSGYEERMDEDPGDQHIPMNTSPVSLGMEKMGFHQLSQITQALKARNRDKATR